MTTTINTIKMNAFKNMITDQEFFTYIPDCIADGDSYLALIEKAFELTEGALTLEKFDWESTADELQFDLLVNGIAHQFSVDIIADYVDSLGIITGLNQLLEKIEYDGSRKFCDTDGGVADFGMAFITTAQEAELAGGDLILRPKLARAVA